MNTAPTKPDAKPMNPSLQYVLILGSVTVCIYVLVGFRAWFPNAVWVLLFYGIVLGGWMAASLASHSILAGALARRKTGMDPWMQVIATIAWSVGNLVLISAIVTVLTLALRPTP
ncbi:MAG TPA: hypothetical protein VHN77_03340 [Phycisphaerales bacterium]|nr:hypothetical protein [Phycisphaerales bacterium]